MKNEASITVPLPPGFTGRILIHVEGGVKASHMTLPEDYIVGAFEATMELMIGAGLMRPAPPQSVGARYIATEKGQALMDKKTGRRK